MEPLHVAHLLALGIWLGIVITEVLFEFSGSDADSLRAAARFHYTVDMFGELPVLAAVIVTGVLLASRVDPLTPLHYVKIAAWTTSRSGPAAASSWGRARGRCPGSW